MRVDRRRASLTPTEIIACQETLTPRPPLVVLAGATATGKTGLALQLAEAFPGGEIISADATQVYRGLDIGTAKVSAADRARVPHHGLDLVEPDEPFSVADFARHAEEALGGIAQRGGWALLVGGTGFYIRAVARGLALDLVPTDRALRASLELELEAEGLPPLVERLRHLAPSLAGRRRPQERAARRPGARDRLPPGRSPAARSARLRPPGAVARPVRRPPRPTASGSRTGHARSSTPASSRRRRRSSSGIRPTLLAFNAIGYREAFGVLDGSLTRDEAIAKDAARNVAYARRQRTWFRREPDIEWLDAGAEQTPARAQEAVARYLAP